MSYDVLSQRTRLVVILSYDKFEILVLCSLFKIMA